MAATSRGSSIMFLRSDSTTTWCRISSWIILEPSRIVKASAANDDELVHGSLTYEKVPKSSRDGGPENFLVPYPVLSGSSL
ncbi:hypothetical protein V6N13_032822 [Hibiscus sabdariffa]|uniref:Uncharacterized protein n=1 Tax=Hibiscus sabdariffa TaxID=183260 RepID=A0ABR1ZKN3_9ROSI